MYVKNEALELLDNLFLDKATATDEEHFEENLANALPRVVGREDFQFKVRCNTDVIFNNSIYGIRVYPDLEENWKVACVLKDNAIAYEDFLAQWNSITSWYVEIDEKMFSREINLTNKEITALLLLELGYVMFSTQTSDTIYEMFKKHLINVPSWDRETLRYLYMLYMVPIGYSCMLHEIDTDLKNGIKLYTDIFNETEYAEYFTSAYTKIVKTYGTFDRFAIYPDIVAKLDSIFTEANKFILDFIKRKRYLKDYLTELVAGTASVYLTDVGLTLLDNFKVELRERYSGMATESAMAIEIYKNGIDDDTHKSEYNFKYISTLETAIEGAINGVKRTIANETFNKIFRKLPSQYDIDMISIEIDKMENQRDRIYVLDLIYDAMNKINLFMEAFEYDDVIRSRNEAKCIDLLKQLDDQRKRCLEKRQFDSNYKFFVKYPKGYEG
jgi:hypothetical protein